MRVKSARIVEIEREAIERVLELCRAVLAGEDFEILRGLVDTLARMAALIRERGSSIARLRRLFGLSGSEKSRDVLPPQPPAAEPARAPDPVAGPSEGNAVAPGPPAASSSPPVDAGATPPKEKSWAAKAPLLGTHVAVHGPEHRPA